MLPLAQALELDDTVLRGPQAKVAALLATFAAPAAGLLALVAPSNEQGAQCSALLQQMRTGR